MADRSVDVLIVGAGPAGATCAETLRASGFEGSILLAGREPDPPYERPPASKEYLRGDRSREECLLHPEAFWADAGIELLTRASVMKMDVAERVAKLSVGGEVAFDRALIATGANVRRLRVDGATLEGIHYLRALANADAIRDDAASAENVVLIGGSYIACEVAATLTQMGRRCTLVMMEEQPLSTGFGAAVGGWFEQLLRSHGIEMATGETLARFEGPEGGRVERVVCESGLTLDADLVVMGTGAVPDVMLARAAGLELGDTGGVRCSASLETSAPRIWAAGDVCEYDSVLHGGPTRIEHFEVARAQGAHVARAMLGSDAPFSEVPYFWTDLADWATAEYVGSARSWDREVVRGSMEDGAFTVFYLEAGRVAAALTVGRSGDLDLARRLIAGREDVSGRENELAAIDGELVSQQG